MWFEYFEVGSNCSIEYLEAYSYNTTSGSETLIDTYCGRHTELKIKSETQSLILIYRIQDTYRGSFAGELIDYDSLGLYRSVILKNTQFA